MEVQVANCYGFLVFGQLLQKAWYVITQRDN